MNPTKFSHTLTALLAIIAAVVPGLLVVLGMLHYHWTMLIASGAAALLALIVNGRAVAFLNLIIQSIWPGTPPVEQPTVKASGAAPGKVLLFPLIILAGLLFAAPARAQIPSPQYGGCFKSGTICLAPSASITLGELNLSTGKFAGGIMPGVGYGATFFADQWYQVGVDLYFSFLVSQAVPNNATPSLVFSFANYARLGFGYSFTEVPSGPMSKEPIMMFALGSSFGGSTSYQVKQARALEAERSIKQAEALEAAKASGDVVTKASAGK